MKITTLLLTVLLLISCDKDGSDGDSLHLHAHESSFANIERGGLDDLATFTFFSLSKNDTVNVTSPKTSSEWDLGFGSRTAGYRPDGQGGTVPITQSVIVVNGGTSGEAQGKGFLLVDTLFAEVTAVSDNLDDSLTVDAMVNGLLTPAINTGSGTWYNYDPTTHQLSPNPTHVALIKTADGKYAKVQIVEMYYKGENDVTPDYSKSGYFTIKFVLQEDADSKGLDPS